VTRYLRDAKRRASKRQKGFLDNKRLVEAHPKLRKLLSAELAAKNERDVEVGGAPWPKHGLESRALDVCQAGFLQPAGQSPYWVTRFRRKANNPPSPIASKSTVELRSGTEVSSGSSSAPPLLMPNSPIAKPVGSVAVTVMLVR